MTSTGRRARSHLIEGPAEPAALHEIRQWRDVLDRTRYARPAPLPLDAVPGWYTGAAEAAFTHRSGRFFAVRGRRVSAGGSRTWAQPMIDQPEVGLLAFAITPSERGFAALVQAKAEPGNINGVQLSPTVQATLSNQERVHGGQPVPYLELFDPATADVLVDCRQSEHGAVFWRKRNRVMIVRTPPIEPREGYRWVELADLVALLHDDDLVHADTRAVLSCAPWTVPGGLALPGTPPPALSRTLAAAAGCDLRPLARWLSDQRTRRSMTSTPVALPEMVGWHRSADALARDDGSGFEIVAVGVEAAGREIDRWAQPMVRPRGVGVVGLAVTERDGQLHLLLQACPEPGLIDGVELGPTVQIAGGDPPRSPLEAELLALLSGLPAAEVLLDTVLSDEGGRFLHGRNRHLVAVVDPFDAPPGYRWCTLGEVVAMLIHGHQINMQARSALVCLLGAAAGDRSAAIPRDVVAARYAPAGR